MKFEQKYMRHFSSKKSPDRRGSRDVEMKSLNMFIKITKLLRSSLQNVKARFGEVRCYFEKNVAHFWTRIKPINCEYVYFKDNQYYVVNF